LLETWNTTPLVAPVIETVIGPVPPAVAVFLTVTGCGLPKFPPMKVRKLSDAGDTESLTAEPLKVTTLSAEWSRL
jgi:hypothetical protein